MLSVMLIVIALFCIGMLACAISMQGARVYAVGGVSPVRWFLQSLAVSWTWPLLLFVHLVNVIERGMIKPGRS